MTYYFFHICLNTDFHKGYISGVLGFTEKEAPNPVEALEKVKDYAASKFPHIERVHLEVTQFNNVT